MPKKGPAIVLGEREDRTVTGVVGHDESQHFLTSDNPDFVETGQYPFELEGSIITKGFAP